MSFFSGYRCDQCGVEFTYPHHWPVKTMSLWIREYGWSVSYKRGLGYICKCPNCRKGKKGNET